MNKTYIKYLNENLGVIDSATSAYDNTDQEEVPSDVFDPNAPALNSMQMEMLLISTIIVHYMRLLRFLRNLQIENQNFNLLIML